MTKIIVLLLLSASTVLTKADEASTVSPDNTTDDSCFPNDTCTTGGTTELVANISETEIELNVTTPASLPTTTTEIPQIEEILQQSSRKGCFCDLKV